MHPHPTDCPTVLRNEADEHSLILIFDDGAAGFGRPHLCRHQGHDATPAMACLSKTHTEGDLSLATGTSTAEVDRNRSASDSTLCAGITAARRSDDRLD